MLLVHFHIEDFLENEPVLQRFLEAELVKLHMGNLRNFLRHI